MIPGYFDAEGCPRLSAQIVIPNLRIQGKVEFVVDTGASRTCLHPLDASLLGVPFAALEYTKPGGGIGGDALYAECTADVVFRDTSVGWVPYQGGLWVGQPTTVQGLRLPSLLGRDILHQWNMRYEPLRGILEFYPDS